MTKDSPQPTEGSPGELLVLDMASATLLSLGATWAQIGARLGMSTPAAKNRGRRLREALGVTKSSEAVTVALARGLIDKPEPAPVPTLEECMRRAQDRFWAKVAGGSFDACWLWTGAGNFGGYGNFNLNAPTKRFIVAHRFAYLTLVGEIPADLELDHLCRTPPCVNPWHLDPVPRSVNVRRGTAPTSLREKYQAQTHCLRNHEFTPENTWRDTRGHRVCRACRRIYDARRAAKLKDRAALAVLDRKRAAR